MPEHPPAPRRHVPVGTELSESEWRQWSQQELENRELRDPRFAGYDPHFDPSHYVRIDVRNPDTRKKVAGTIAQFASTPDGQWKLRQAQAMQAYRAEHGSWGEPDASGHVRIGITDAHNPRQFNPLNINRTSNSDITTGTIHLERDTIENVEYRGTDGRYYDESYQDVLGHELSHLGDGMLSAGNLSALQRARHPDGFRPRRAQDIPKADRDITEVPAMRDNNRFMQQLYQQPPRVADHGAVRFELPLADAVFGTNPPQLGPDHYYDQLAPGATPPRPTDANRGKPR